MKKIKYHSITCVMIMAISSFALFGCASKSPEITWEGMEEASTEESMEEETTLEANSGTEVESMTSQDLAEAETGIYVHICGAVANPGVYETSQDARLYEIIELAGGLLDEADGEYINLARTVSDGEQIVVYTKEETKAMEEAGITQTSKTAAADQGSLEGQATNALININTASVSELTSITGIGESRAKDIIAYREAHGGFGTIEDIMKVSGIKDGLFNKIKDQICV